MWFLDLTMDSVAADLALDEALLDAAEAADAPMEVLRLWEPRRPAVVVGRSSRVRDEVRLDVCRAQGVPVLRRVSGGAAIVTGPGCLMYALVLSYEHRPEMRSVNRAHRLVLDRLAQAIAADVPQAGCRGVSDLAMGDRKVSGNSLRCKRRHLLYHGTLMYGFDTSQIARLLPMPPRQPDYREGRAHDDFVANLPLSVDALRDGLKTAFSAHEPYPHDHFARVAELVAQKYGSAAWNERL